MALTAELVAEHEAVLVALRILESVTAALGAGDPDAGGHLDEVLEFLQVFVDRCHHGKEEDVLFPELERRGIRRQGGPVGVMLAEHEAGRGLVRAMLEDLAALRGGDAGAAARVEEGATEYRGLLVSHIAKENGVLFPMAERVVPDDVAAALVERFALIERERIGVGRHEAFHATLHRLRERYLQD
jgi:hemerythrin-like domain-containing protein